MRSTLDEREQSETEITLGTATLLSIFFGLVVVCGVFFGFGYSIGRRATTLPTAPPADSAPATVESRAPKPSAHQASLTTVTQPPAEASETAAQPANETPASDADARAVTVKDPSGEEAQPKPAAMQRAAVTTAPSAAVDQASGNSASMVQIAAVSHQEDAEVLVSALRKRGYNVSIRGELQDKLLHVQVGPFASRSEAIAMKQKLLADGYNAFVK